MTSRNTKQKEIILDILQANKIHPTIHEIYELAKNDLIPTLAISLHAPNHTIREQIMPIEKKYNVEFVDRLENKIRRIWNDFARTKKTLWR